MSEPVFRAWALPAGIDVESRERSRIIEGLAYARASDAWWSTLCARLRDAHAQLQTRSARDIASALGEVGERFAEAGDPLREAALEWLPVTSSLSEAMAEHVLDGMARDWSTARLTRLLELEFDPPELLDRFVEREGGASAHVRSPALTLHVGAGTVPGVTATSLVRSLLVKSAALVKPGLGDAVLPVLWGRGLREVDPGLADACAIAYWPGGETTHESGLYAEVDAVVAYGSDATLLSIRDRLPLSTPFVSYRHRAGAAAISSEVLTAESLRSIARDTAYAASVFDQRGCVSPHVVYVESGSEVTAEGFVDALAEALDALAKELPPGKASLEEASALQQLRGSAEMRASEAASGVEVRFGSEGAWSVVLDPDPTFRPSCLRRFVWVKPVEDLSRLPSVLAPIASALQTMALAVSEARRGGVIEALSEVGVSRFTTLAGAPWPPAWWHHDGEGPLRALTTWVDDESAGAV